MPALEDFKAPRNSLTPRHGLEIVKALYGRGLVNFVHSHVLLVYYTSFGPVLISEQVP